MAGRTYTSELLALLEENLRGYIIERRNMFGCPVFFAGGRLFCGVDGDTIFIRLSEADRNIIKAEFDEARHFDPMGGHPMREYIVLPELFQGRMDLLSMWLNRSFEYARTLPVKKKRSRKKKSKATNKKKRTP